MKSKTIIGIVVGAVILCLLSVPVALTLSSNSSGQKILERDNYASYAVYRSNGGTLSFLEWIEKGGPNSNKANRGEVGVYPKSIKITPDGDLILVLSNGTEINAGKIPLEKEHHD